MIGNVYRYIDAPDRWAAYGVPSRSWRRLEPGEKVVCGDVADGNDHVYILYTVDGMRAYASDNSLKLYFQLVEDV